MSDDMYTTYTAQFKVWYIPQIPGKAFEVGATTAKEASTILDILTSFSLFEFENRVKPDYSDAGGVMEWSADEGEYNDVEDEDE